MRYRDIMDLFRPFEVLKLIRDGVVSNIRDFYAIRHTQVFNYINHLMDGLDSFGLIDVDGEGNINAHKTEIDEFVWGLCISLTQTTPYAFGSVVCDPEFGRPNTPPVATDLFVVMPFADYLQLVYDGHIKKVATKMNVGIPRADDFFSASSIVDDVWNAINAARIVIADCTGRNANVFYEIGIAHTLGKPVVLCAQTTDDIPFDVQHLCAIVYEFTLRGMQEFEEVLTETIEFELSYPASIEDCIMRHRSLKENG